MGLGPKTGPLVISPGTLEPSVTYKVAGVQATGVGPKYAVSIPTFTQVPPFTVSGTVSALPATVEIVNVKYDDQGVDNADTTCVPKAKAEVPLAKVTLPSEPPANPDGAITVQGTPTAGGTLA